MNDNSKSNFLSRLWEKKVPQYLGTYFAVGFGLLQFVEFAVKRYQLGDALVDKYLLIWSLLLPAVIILIYFHNIVFSMDRAKRFNWPRFVVFGNVLFAVVLGSLLSNNKVNAQNQDKLVQLVDEEGEELEVLVPSLDRIKTIACFQFINETNDPSLDWWGVAFSALTQASLIQMPEFYAASQVELNQHYDVLGLRQYSVPNLGLQKQIAQKSRNDYFTRLSYNIVDGVYVIKGSLYNGQGSRMTDFNIENKDPYRAIDQLTNAIYKYYFKKLEGSLSEVLMPSSVFVSANKEALKNLVLSSIYLQQNPNELDETLKLAKKSVDIDPTCSNCQLAAGLYLYIQGKPQEADIYFKNAIKYSASLPKRFQFTAKELYYRLNGNTEAWIKLLELRRKMFPYDFEPYEVLKNIYLMNKGIDSTKALLNEAIDNGNLEKGLLALYTIELNNEDYEDAERTLKRLVKEFPGREQDMQKFSDLYLRQGKLKEAKKHLTELEALNPFDTDIQTDLAYLEFRNLELKDAMARVNKGIAQATSLSDSLDFILTKSYFHRRMGQINKAQEIMAEYQVLASRQMPRQAVLSQTFRTMAYMYLYKGQNEKVDELVTEINSYYPGQTTGLSCRANTIALNIFDDVDLGEDIFSSCMDELESLGKGYETYYGVYEAYYKGEYKECLTLLEANEGEIMNRYTNNFLANVYLKSGNYDKALELIAEEVNKKPDDPLYYLRMAELLEKEDPIRSKKYLKTLFEFWFDADEDFILYQRAKELENRLSSS